MQARSPLCIFLTLNWAYALHLRKQFCRNNQKRTVKTLSRSNFHKTKAKGVVGF